MKGLSIAVLRGGPSDEYEVSLKSGAAVIDALEKSGKPSNIIDILIDKQKQWHRNGLLMPMADALKGVDVAVIAMHGRYGEDGELQRELEILKVPYTGSGSYASSLAMNKPRARFAVKPLPMIKLPEHYLILQDDINSEEDYHKVSREIFRRFGPPYIVKPANGGSSVGIVIANTFMDLPNAIKRVGGLVGYPILVEQRIFGREVTCGVIEKYRDHEYYALPPVEIILPEHADIFDYNVKYATDEKVCAQEVCPANFDKSIKYLVEDAAKAVHKILGLRHYSRTDFILSNHGLYFLESNTLPGLTQQSLLPKSLEVVGANLSDLLEHLVGLALSEK